MRSTFCRFNENIIASASTDLSFALWDVNKRDERGVPNFMRRIAIPEKVIRIIISFFLIYK